MAHQWTSVDRSAMAHQWTGLLWPISGQVCYGPSVDSGQVCYGPSVDRSAMAHQWKDSLLSARRPIMGH